MVKPAKRRPSYEERNPVLSKLLDLKTRLQKASEDKGRDTKFISTDKIWVMDLINDVRNNNIIKLSREDGLKCNGLWKKYETN
tara:strand:- start:290 stop:538 length:249 start_codon:yes stop_codon:yes gene_type:complete